MADPFVAEIRMFPFTFAPKGWAFCEGQLLPLSQNTALFSLLGTTYGGNGETTFALPNLSGRTPLHPGQGPGLSQRHLGEMGGESSVSLTSAEIPAHSHAIGTQAVDGTRESPEGGSFAQAGAGRPGIYGTTVSGTMAPQAFSVAGGGQHHNNMQPFLVMNFCIALQGIFPPRW